MGTDRRPSLPLRVAFCSLAAAIPLQPGAPAARAAETPAARPPVEIGSARGVVGEKVRGALKVAEDADGTPIVLPLTIIAGKKPGPVAWVQAATHGDEYGGARAPAPGTPCPFPPRPGRVPSGGAPPRSPSTTWRAASVFRRSGATP